MAHAQGRQKPAPAKAGVRPSHADREGHVFAWGDAPDGGHPGEDYNCRCWAEAVNNVKIPPKPPRKPDRKAKCFTDPYQDDAFALVLRFERNITWPYLDTKGKITIGIGANVDRRQDFMALPLIVADTKKLATLEQKAAGYEKLKQIAAARLDGDGNMNRSSDSFTDETNLRLDEDVGKRMARAAIRNFEKDLSQRFSGFMCFPAPAKSALMDMIYNIGATRFTRERWPTLFGAAGARDWRLAADESHRKDVGADRNRDIKKLFLDAEKMEEEARKN